MRHADPADSSEPLEGAKLAIPDLHVLRERHTQSADQTEEVEKADIRLSALDCADVVAVHAHASPKLLLAQVSSRAQLAHGAAESAEGIVLMGSASVHKAY